MTEKKNNKRVRAKSICFHHSLRTLITLKINFLIDDIKIRSPFQNGKGINIYIESLADPNLIHQLALEPLLTRSDLSLDKAFLH